MKRQYSKTIFAIFIFIIMLNIITKPGICIEGATSGLLLWFNKLLPSLLPFIILTNMLFYLNILHSFGHILDHFTQKTLNIPGASFITFIMGLIGGYPTGAKLSKQLLDSKTLSHKEAEKTFFFSNNCGCLFIIGTVGTLLLDSTSIGYFLLLIHILSALTILLLLKDYTPHSVHSRKASCPPSATPSFPTVLAYSVQNAMDTIVYVGGYVIFFSVLIAIANDSILLTHLYSTLGSLFAISPIFFQNILLGSLEFSNGVFLVSQTTPFSPNALALISSLIAFGGFCVLFQSSHIIQNSNFSLLRYLFLKLIQALLAYCYTLLFYPLFFYGFSLESLLPTLLFFIVLIVVFILLRLIYTSSIRFSLQNKK